MMQRTLFDAEPSPKIARDSDKTYLSNLEHGRREWNPLLVKKANAALAMIRLMRANDRLARQTKRMNGNGKACD